MATEFSPQTMQKAFKRIASHYYERNFGSMSKANLEILLFDIYYKNRKSQQLPLDDYTLSKELGISQTRIRTLKSSRALQYADNNSDEIWKQEFVHLIENARYVDEQHQIKMTVPDIVVLIELRNYIEKNGWYDEYTLNPKLFTCSLPVFLEICSHLEDEKLVLSKEEKSKLKELKAKEPKGLEKSPVDLLCEGKVNEGLKVLAMETGKEFLIDVLKMIPFGGTAGMAIKALYTVLSR